MSDDLRIDFDRMIEVVNRISQIEHLRDMVREAASLTKKRCGNCQHWMNHFQCPRERHDGGSGRWQGPHIDEYTCSKHAIDHTTLDIQAAKIAEAAEYAKSHNLPIPPLGG